MQSVKWNRWEGYIGRAGGAKKKREGNRERGRDKENRRGTITG